ncbi:MAG: hypothetical protein JST62_10210, partial [Bacteroidetes bacterium]|nr:hypothetical protein [Bacteroidota bacterium]
MRKTLSYLSFLFVFLLFLNACRTNEIVENEITQNEKIGAFVRFEEKMKTSKNTSQNYNQPFAEVIGNYLTNHSSYRNNFEATIGKIDLSMSSQSFGNDYKVVLFPIRNTSNIVTDILVAQVNEDRDFVQFRLLLDDDFKSDAIADFNAKNGNKSGNKSSNPDDIKTKDIEEVQVKPPKKDNTISIPISYFIYPTTSLPKEMDGGSPKHGGGGGSWQPPSGKDTLKSPCAKIDINGKHHITDSLMTNLKNLSTKKNANGEYNETGYAIEFSSDGKININQQYGPDAGFNFSLSNKIDVYIHNHTPNGLSVFSIADLASLALLYKGNKIKNTNTFVFGVVTPTTEYFITISDPTALSSFADKLITYNSSSNTFTIDENKYDTMDFLYRASGVKLP